MIDYTGVRQAIAQGLALCVLLFTHLSHAQEKPLVLSNHPDQASVSLTEYFAILEDPSNKLGFDDIQQAEWAQRFTTGQPPAASLIYGFTRSAYWLRLRLHNPHSNPVERFLDINYARLANVQLYHQSPDGHVLSWTTGTDFPFATRPHPNRGFVFPLTLMTQGEGIGRINTPSSSKSTIKNRLLAIATLLSAH